MYLAIDISLSEVKVALWSAGEGDEGKVRILGVGRAEFYQDEEGLLEAIESSLSLAWSLVPKEFSLDKEIVAVVFAVPQFWMNNQLRTEKLSLLQRLSRELKVKPLGFVSEAEVILSYLKKEEGKFLNLIIFSVGDERIDITSVSQGKVLGSQSIERSDNIVLDLEEGLSRFDMKNPFPPRILLLGRGDLEEIRQAVLSYPWLEAEKSLFLHLPKIEIFPSRLILEVLVAETGREAVLKETVAAPDSQEQPDIGKTSLGFLKNRDVARLRSSSSVSGPQPGEKETRNITRLGRWLYGAIGNPIRNLGKALAWLSHVHSPRLLGVVLLGLFLVLAALLAAWWYLPKATVVLFVQPRFSEENFLLAVSPQATAVNAEDKIIPGKVLSSEISGHKTAETKGKKNVGDKAAGEVTIYNRTELAKTFHKGTVLWGPNKMKFLTTERAEVASASADPTLETLGTPGKRKVKVEAADIGADYNLAEGTEFRIDLFSDSDFIAKNEKAFSGGSSREIRVVDKKDQEQLEESLRKELMVEAGKKLAKNLDDGEDLIKESINFKTISKQFDHRVGDEADNISLSLKLKINALALTQRDIDVLVSKILEKRTPQGFALAGEKKLNFKFLKRDGDKMVFDFGVKANLYPQMDREKIKKEIVGRKPQSARRYLSSLSNLEGFEIKVVPKLPGWLLTMPHRQGNIKIKMKIKGQ